MRGSEYGQDLQTRVTQLVPIRAFSHRLPIQEPDDNPDGLIQSIANFIVIDPQHVRVVSQCTGAYSKHEAAHQLVIELNGQVRHQERIMIGERNDTRAQSNSARAFCRSGKHNLRRSDDFSTTGMMLTNPDLIETEAVEVINKLKLTANLQVRILAERHHRGDETSQISAYHSPSSSLPL